MSISFKHFISESKFDLDKFFEECGPILSQYKQMGFPLYRGDPTRENIVKLTFRERSGPRDSSVELHDAMNKNFEKHFNVKARNWLFTANTTMQASAYGSVRAIFPIGSLEFVYSEKVYDALHLYNKLKGEFRIKNPSTGYDEAISNVISHIEQNLVNEYDYVKTKDISNLTDKNEFEIMVKCDKFYSISVHSDEYMQIMNRMNKDQNENKF